MPCVQAHRCQETEDWKQEHRPHLLPGQRFIAKSFEGSYDWYWLQCPCGDRHLTAHP